jgi:hypothetical protein
MFRYHLNERRISRAYEGQGVLVCETRSKTQKGGKENKKSRTNDEMMIRKEQRKKE